MSIIEPGGWVKVYESPALKQSQLFPAVAIRSSKLCGGSLNLPIMVQLLNYKSNGRHKLKGQFVCRVSELENNPGKLHDFWNKYKNKSAGKLLFSNFRKKQNFRFLDYLRGGLNIQVITCIDFTGSNGVSRFPESLHYMCPGYLNQYQTAITSVCSILENYDYDKIITVYGFGGKPQFPDLFSTETSHFFPCSGNYSSPGAKGVDGVFQLYNFAIQNVELAGPTHFAPLLDQVIKYTQARS